MTGQGVAFLLAAWDAAVNSQGTGGCYENGKKGQETGGVPQAKPTSAEEYSQSLNTDLHIHWDLKLGVCAAPKEHLRPSDHDEASCREAGVARRNGSISEMLSVLHELCARTLAACALVFNAVTSLPNRPTTRHRYADQPLRRPVLLRIIQQLFSTSMCQSVRPGIASDRQCRANYVSIARRNICLFTATI